MENNCICLTSVSSARNACIRVVRFLLVNIAVREVSAHLLYDFNRLTSIGVREKSCILLRPTKDGKKIRIEWFVDIPDAPSFRPKPTPEELAAKAAAAAKVHANSFRFFFLGGGSLQSLSCIFKAIDAIAV